jgi:preprotein translocase subunit YajC
VAQLLILVFFGFLLMWVFVVLPQRRRMAAHDRMVEEIKVGDEILTAGGLFGDVTEVGEDEVAVEIAPGVEVRVATRAIANVIPPDTYDDEGEGEAGEQAAHEDGMKNTEVEGTREPTGSDRR